MRFLAAPVWSVSLILRSTITLNLIIEKILVFSFNFISDAVLATTVISPLRQRFPDAKITFLVGSLPFDLLAADPQVDQFLLYDNLDEHAG